MVSKKLLLFEFTNANANNKNKDLIVSSCV